MPQETEDNNRDGYQVRGADIQTDRKTDTQTDKQTDRQKERKAEKSSCQCFSWDENNIVNDGCDKSSSGTERWRSSRQLPWKRKSETILLINKYIDFFLKKSVGP